MLPSTKPHLGNRQRNRQRQTEMLNVTPDDTVIPNVPDPMTSDWCQSLPCNP